MALRWIRMRWYVEIFVRSGKKKTISKEEIRGRKVRKKKKKRKREMKKLVGEMFFT